MGQAQADQVPTRLEASRSQSGLEKDASAVQKMLEEVSQWNRLLLSGRVKAAPLDTVVGDAYCDKDGSCLEVVTRSAVSSYPQISPFKILSSKKYEPPTAMKLFRMGFENK